MKNTITRRAIFSMGLAATTCGFLIFPVSPVAAQEAGTPTQAKAMLDRTVAALKIDKTKTLAAISNREKGFIDRDLYVFCFGPDGKIDAHPDPARIGREAKSLRDRDGKAYGEEMLRVVQEGTISRVDYLRSRLGSSEPVPKHSFMTRIGDQVCGVGYYDITLARSAACDLACQHGGSH